MHLSQFTALNYFREYGKHRPFSWLHYQCCAKQIYSSHLTPPPHIADQAAVLFQAVPWLNLRQGDREFVLVWPDRATEPQSKHSVAHHPSHYHRFTLQLRHLHAAVLWCLTTAAVVNDGSCSWWSQHVHRRSCENLITYAFTVAPLS